MGQWHHLKVFLVLIGLFFCQTSIWAQAVQPVPALAARVMDLAGALTPAQMADIEKPLVQLEGERGTQMVVLVVNSTLPEDIDGFTNRVASAWKLGHSQTGEGVLVVVAVHDRKMRIEVARNLEGQLPDLLVNRIIQNDMTPEFKSGDYAKGISRGVNRLVQELGVPVTEMPKAAEKSPEQLDLMTFGQMVAVSGILLLIFLLGSSRGQLWESVGGTIFGLILCILCAGLFYVPGMLFGWPKIAYGGYFLGYLFTFVSAFSQRTAAVGGEGGGGRVVADASGKVLGRILTEPPKKIDRSADNWSGSDERSDSSDYNASTSSGSDSYSSGGGGSYGGGGSSGRW